jgi:uncharacterized protein YkwD
VTFKGEDPMTRVRSLIACLLAMALLAMAAVPAEARSPSSLMVRKINQLRKAHHLRPLRVSRLLMRSSRTYARRMMRNDEWRHSRGGRARRSFRRFGEVLAYHTGYRPYCARTVRSWRNSRGHRRVLLDRRVRWLGVGMARGNFRGRRATIWVARVGAR